MKKVNAKQDDYVMLDSEGIAQLADDYQEEAKGKTFKVHSCDLTLITIIMDDLVEQCVDHGNYRVVGDAVTEIPSMTATLFNYYWDKELAIRYVYNNPDVKMHRSDSIVELVDSYDAENDLIEIGFRTNYPNEAAAVKENLERPNPFVVSASWVYVMNDELWTILVLAKEGDTIEPKEKKPRKKRKPSFKFRGKRVSKKNLRIMFGGKES